MHSMTGFGRGSHQADGFLATVEIATVNRKQAEVVINAPRELAELEDRVRKAVACAASRGRVQVSIKLDASDGAARPVRVDVALAQALDAAFVTLSEALGRTIRAEASDFLRQPGVISLESGELDGDAAWTAIEPALSAALEQMLAMRAREGADLQADLTARIEVLEKLGRKIAGHAEGRVGRQRELLLKRLRDAGLEFDVNDERVVKEIALFAERCDISEEVTRLDSHLAKFREYLAGSDAAGRALDFLCQELHREFNTMGSKANDAAVAQTVVEAKTELEKVREQVQNVE